MKIQERSARKQALSDKNKEKDRENQAAILKEQPLVEGMMKFGWLPEDFIVKKETLKKSQLLAFLKSHRLEVQCKTALLAILSPANMPRGLSSANATTCLIVDFLLTSFSQIAFHRNPNNVQLADMVAGELESDEQDSDVN